MKRVQAHPRLRVSDNFGPSKLEFVAGEDRPWLAAIYLRQGDWVAGTGKTPQEAVDAIHNWMDDASHRYPADVVVMPEAGTRYGNALGIELREETSVGTDNAKVVEMSSRRRAKLEERGLTLWKCEESRGTWWVGDGTVAVPIFDGKTETALVAWGHYLNHKDQYHRAGEKVARTPGMGGHNDDPWAG